MNSDFIYIDPNKIPPRRSVKKNSSRGVKLHRTPPVYEPADFEETVETESGSDFGVPPGEFQIHFAAHQPADLSSDPESAPALPVGAPTPKTVGTVEPKELDPLTHEIFFAPRPRPFPAPPPFKPENVFKFDLDDLPAEKPATVASAPAPKEQPASTESREDILAELERIDSMDAELFKKIKRVNSPTRASHVNYARDLSGEEIKQLSPGIRLHLLKWRQSAEKNICSDAARRGDSAKDISRAEDDWFQVKLAAADRVSKIKQIPSKDFEEVLPDSKSEYDFDAADRDDDGKKIKIFIASVFLALVPLAAGVFLFSGKDNFLKNAINTINAKVLSSSSFVLVNSESSTTFPGISKIVSQLEKTGAAEEVGSFFDEFLTKNSSFGWLNIFKKKEVGRSASIEGLDLLEKAKEKISSLGQAGLKPVEDDLGDEITSLNFWQQFLSQGRQYLIVLVDPDVSRPIGGKPSGYAIVKSTGEGLETAGSGKFLALDAASDLKKIPPFPVQVFSTTWMPSDAGWFFDFTESGKTLADFFEGITQLKVDGVIMVSRDFLKDLSFRESLIFDMDSPNWFYGLVDALERKPNHRWTGMADDFEKAVKSHKIQFYFKDAFMQGYALNSGWLASTKISSNKEDALGITMATFQGQGPDLELIESRNSVSADGSVLVRLSVMARQNSAGGSKNYFKIYIPKNSEILTADGFSQKEKIPKFEYLANSFTPDSRIGNYTPFPDDKSNAETFEESGLAVVGGWVDAVAQERRKISIEYNLPFKLSVKNNHIVYLLNMWRPSQSDDVPFRFNLLPQDGLEIVSLEPNGFVSENLGEYQGSLSGDLKLTATLSSVSE